MKQIVWFVLLVLVIVAITPVRSTAAQDGCETAFDDAHAFTAEVYDRMIVSENGEIIWDSTDWVNIVRRVVTTSEFYLHNCMDADQPLADQEEALDQFAALSLLQAPVEMLDIGGDFGEIVLESGFVPQTVLLDLNGDGEVELVLHTQVPYFSEATVYQIRGGLSIAFFFGEDGWQGQVIAPVTDFVTDETGDHVSFAMVEDSTLSAETASAALHYFPAPSVELINVPDSSMPLTAITLMTATPTGEAKELNVLSWDGRIPSVKLRVVFDDWCYPGRMLDWDIRADGSVFVPSNGGDADSSLHCGRTPEVLFTWENDHYVVQQ